MSGEDATNGGRAAPGLDRLLRDTDYADRVVAVALAIRDADGTPTDEQLARRLGWSDTQVRYVLYRMERDGLVGAAE